MKEGKNIPNFTSLAPIMKKQVRLLPLMLGVGGFVSLITAYNSLFTGRFSYLIFNLKIHSLYSIR